MIEKRKSKREAIVMAAIDDLPARAKFCSWDLSVKIAMKLCGKRDWNTEQNYRQVMSKLLPELAEAGELRFLGEETGTAPHRKKIYQKI